MANDRIASTAEGTIACSNERGIKLVGGDKWVNISKFAGEIIIPPAGTRVVLGLDKAGFIREIGSAAGVGPVGPTTEIVSIEIVSANTVPGKDVQIARMNAITNAITIVASNGTAAISDVLAVATELERWVLR